MREHALPQDVTGYRFHIIGSMTLKQFAEVGAGCVVGFIIFTTGLPDLIKWPLILFFAGLGAFAAFIPVSERPFDQWLIAFVRALYRPTEYYWKRETKIPEAFTFKPKSELSTMMKDVDLTPARRQRVLEYMRSVHAPHLNDSDDAFYQQRMTEITQIFQENQGGKTWSSQVVSTTNSFQMNANPTNTTTATTFSSDTQPTLSQLQDSIPETTFNSFATVNSQTPSTTTFSTPTTSTSTSVPPSSVQVPQIESIAVQPQVTVTKQTVLFYTTISGDQAFVENATPSLSNTSAQPATYNTTLPFPTKPTEPNKVVGMVLDQEQKPLVNAIVEIVTDTGLPARAVKTNVLGQFFVTTPLNNGTYTVQVEKDGYQFTPQQISVSGQIIDPIEVRST